MKRFHPFRLAFLLIFLSFIPLVVGCQGCRGKDKTVEQKKEEQEKKKEIEKPNFEVEPTVFFPGQYQESIKRNRVKEGHWFAADFRVKANKFDLNGEMTANATSTSLRPLPVESTDYFQLTSRSISLAKDEPKNLETSVFIPRKEIGNLANVKFVIGNDTSSIPYITDAQAANLLRPHQYHLVTLTNRPDAYGYLNQIDSIKLPRSNYGLDAVLPFYSVVLTRPSEEPISLPRQALQWTTIAYVIWDDLNLDQLDDEQKQAMVDWIHFGGQLILSGPDCLQDLENSFLREFLPAKVTAVRNFVAKDFMALNENWAVKNPDTDQFRTIQVDAKAPILALDLELNPNSEFVRGTGKIVAERQVGRGRICVTAFSMDDKPVVNWPSYRSLFNGALLRKPPRKFGSTIEDCYAFWYLNDEASIFDPLLGSTLRYLSRDLSNLEGEESGTPKLANIPAKQITGIDFQNNNFGDSRLFPDERFRPTIAPKLEARNLEDTWHYGGFIHDDRSGTAGWNDNSGVSQAARETLKQAAGITPPSSEFVLRTLAIYLLVLVPINWGFFRLIGKVEWAWIAAPVIAIAGALMVARMASLDIGFVRSNTQVACLEVYADYSRGHIAQYSALYTSLSTKYNLEMDNQTAQSLPFGDPNRKWKEKSISPVTLRKSIKNRMEGFQVQSNSTGMLHTEMMVDLNGAFSISSEDGQFRINNDSLLNLVDVGVVKKVAKGKTEFAWIGDFQAGTSINELNWESISDPRDGWRTAIHLVDRRIAKRYWNQLESALTTDETGNQVVAIDSILSLVPELQTRWSEFLEVANRLFPPDFPNGIGRSNLTYSEFKQIIDKLQRSDDVDVSLIFNRVMKNLDLGLGEVRLVGLTDQSIGNNSFSPIATQTKQQTLVVVHLKRPKLPDALVDANGVEDLKISSNLDADRQEEQLNAFADQFKENEGEESDKEE